MQLIDLIKSSAWLSVQMALLREYPEAKEDIESYEMVYNLLKVMPPKTSKMTIALSLETDDFDQSSYVDVAGYFTDPAEQRDPFTNSVAIEFVPWNEWLGMNLDTETLNHFTELEIIAHCLHEMTFVGFDEKEIQEQLDHVKDIKEEYDQLTLEERKERITPFEELKAKSGLAGRIKDSEATKGPIMFERVNRDVLIIFYKQPFIDWVNFVNGNDKIKCPALLEHDQGNIYLIPEFDTHDEAMEYVRENFINIFKNELFEWYEDEESWPRDLTWEFFEGYFHYSWQSVVMDTLEDDVQKEEL